MTGRRRGSVGTGPGGRVGRCPGRRPGRRAERRDTDRGAVTAELAVGMVAVAAVLATVMATGAATLTRLTCQDAARSAARVAALGEPEAEVVAAAQHVLGARGGEVTVRHDGGWVTVTVSAPFAAWPGLDGAHARASATGWVEP